MLDLHLIDYKTCHDYAAEHCRKTGIPTCDWYDIGSDAYLLSIKRAGRANADVNPEAYARRLMFTAVIDVIRERNYRRNVIHADAAPVVEPDQNDDNPDDETVPSGIVLGDRGRGAETIRSFDEDWENPLWLRLFDAEREKMRRERRNSPMCRLALRAVNALLKDTRFGIARYACRVSGLAWANVINFLRERLSLSYEALRRAA